MYSYRVVIRIFSFLVIGTIPLLLLYKAMLSHHMLPVLSESMSFDEKAYLLSEADLEQVDVLAIGSSITLDNISSQLIEESLGQKYTYFNLASLGLKMHNHQELLKFYVKKLNPKVVIINSNRRDFRGDDINVASPEDLEKFLNGQYAYFYLKNINLYKILSRHSWGAKIRQDHSTPFSIAFDSSGGVLLQVPDSVKKERPRCLEPSTPTNPLHYAALDSICQFLKFEGVKLIFVESVYEAPKGEEDLYRSVMDRHIERTCSIVEHHGHIHLDLSGLSQILPPYMFADDVHLNESGALSLTQHILQKVNMRYLVTSSSFPDDCR